MIKDLLQQEREEFEKNLSDVWISGTTMDGDNIEVDEDAINAWLSAHHSKLLTALKEEVEGMRKLGHMEQCVIPHLDPTRCGWCVMGQNLYNKAVDDILKLLTAE